jgi:1,4-dihydroxy-2-naphthoate octaprenyltransferase
MGVDDIHSSATKYRLVTGIVPRKHVLWIGIAAFILASVLGIAAMMIGSEVLLLPGLIGACISISYSEKPLMLKYKPCGEACVFLAYGPLLFASCVLSLVGRVSVVDVIFAVPFGLMTTMILLANNIRDYEYDTGKASTLVTKIGVRRSWVLLLTMVHVAYAIILTLAYCDVLQLSSLLVLITYPLLLIAYRKRRDASMVNILGMLHIGFCLITVFCLFGLSQRDVVQNQIDLRDMVNIESSSWAEVQKVVDERVGTSKKGVLFLVDVDNVLTFTDHPCTYPDNVKTHYAFFNGQSAEEINEAWGKVFMNNPQKVIDDYAASVISDWQKNGGSVMGFTSLVVGENNEVIQRRNGNLQAMFGMQPVLSVPQKTAGGAVFYPSCISTDGEKLGKGEALRECLPKMKSKPRVMVFIDDSEKNLVSVREKTPDNCILITIHYTGYQTQIPQSPVTRSQFEEFWKQHLTD